MEFVASNDFLPPTFLLGLAGGGQWPALLGTRAVTMPGPGGSHKRKMPSVEFSLGPKGSKRAVPAKRRKGNVFGSDGGEEKADTKIYVESVSAQQLQKLGSETKQKLVIPLQLSNRWKGAEASAESAAEGRGGAGGGDANEVGREDTGMGSMFDTNVEKVPASTIGIGASDESQESGSKSSEKYGLIAQKRKPKSQHTSKAQRRKPMLLMNAVPGTEGLEDADKFKRDVSLRPDSAPARAYDDVPVEAFGEAMLRGMGWKPGAKVGVGVNARVVDPIQFLQRGYRQGLGADDALVALKNAKKPRKYVRPGESREPRPQLRVAADANGRRRHYQKIGEKLQKVFSKKIQIASLVELIGGPHKGLFGNVEKVGKGGTPCLVSLKVSGAIVRASEEQLEVLNPEELPKNHPAFSTKVIRRASDRADGDARGTKRKKKKSKKRRPVTWVRPNIRVRVVSRSLEGGAYYSKKGTVQDVPSPFEFTLLMDSDGRLVEGVKEHNVDTALPKAGGRVMVVVGADKGRVAVLLERNKKMGKCLIQFDDDQKMAKCGFDKIAEFVPS